MGRRGPSRLSHTALNTRRFPWASESPISLRDDTLALLFASWLARMTWHRRTSVDVDQKHWMRCYRFRVLGAIRAATIIERFWTGAARRLNVAILYTLIFLAMRRRRGRANQRRYQRERANVHLVLPVYLS
jgi:hypothetical protein